MAETDWRPGTPERKQRAHQALAGALDEWSEQGAGPLSFEGGWRPGTPISDSELWATIISLTAQAAGAVGRFSEASRYPEGRSEQTIARRTDDAGVLVWRLAAAILVELDAHPVDHERLLGAAAELIDEIDDEDDGLLHASGQIASLLEARQLCAQEQVPLPADELDRATVGILAPLLAQYACLLTRDQRPS